MIVCNICKTELKDSSEEFMLPVHSRKQTRGGRENQILFEIPAILPKEIHLCENCKTFIADMIRVMQGEPNLYNPNVKKELVIIEKGVMRYLIYGRTNQTALYKLEKIYDSLDKSKIYKYSKNASGNSYIYLHDGTTYKTATVNNSARGHRCDKAFVEFGISVEERNTIILPSLCCSSLPQEEQIEYFD